MFFSLFVATFLPFLSLALPSSHSLSFNHRSTTTRPRILAYYVDWATPKSIDYSLFDAIIFAFAFPDQNCQLIWDTDQAPALLAGLVSAAHSDSTKVMLSIGGWTGSKYFSDVVATAENRQVCADNIYDIYMRYNLDGIDIDWEYPGQVAQQGNTESTTDSQNMFQFFKLLRQRLPPNAFISAAVQDSTFAGPDGKPMSDVSALSRFVDWVTLMNYDTYEIHTTLLLARQPPGPNAPLSDACKNSSQPSQNAVGGYNAWTSAGFPPSKIVLGVPAYGYIIESDVQRLSSRSLSRAYSEDGSGQIQFSSLVNQGILARYPNGSFRASPSSGFTREWDECSATPFIHSAEQVVSYDDNESLSMKAAWVKRMNMGGVNLFDVHGDTAQHDLVHALRANLFPDILQSPAVPSSSSVVSSARVMSMSLPAASQPASSGLIVAPLSMTAFPSSSTLTPTLPGGIYRGN